MEQTLATDPATGGEPNPVDRTGLCLLSLDGGGVRGLSTLYILKGIMVLLNHERKEMGLASVKPCEIFDLIGGTSTGGLIAIMLGRLEMDVDECISAYTELMELVFEQQLRRMPFNIRGRVKPLFDSNKLKEAIERVVNRTSASVTDLFNDGQPRGCRVFVCTTAKDLYGITQLRSYDLPRKPNVSATICEAALATSAATGFFDPICIGERQFVDGALGANNPVDQVEGEATDIWCAETGDLKPLVKCFISIGTGNPGKKAIEDSLLKFLPKTLVEIATQTEETADKFMGRWRQHYDLKRYFRFNVEQGLQDVGLAEYKERGTIETATDIYLANQAQVFRVRDCVKNVKQKQNRTETAFEAIVEEYNARLIRNRTSPHKVCWTVPFLRNTRFVGRVSQIERLEQTLLAKDQPSKLAIAGLGGVGKTQIALELAYRTRDRDPQCSVFWIHAANVESMHQAYIEAGQQLGIGGLEKEGADVERRVQRYLSQESTNRWLLIFDNADDPEESPGLVDHLPRSSRGHVVFTTRSRKVAVKLAQQNVIEVSKMDESMAIQLLRNCLIDESLAENRRDTLELLKQLAYLPLAVVQATEYVNQNGLTLSDYLSLLAEQEQDVIELLSEEFEDEWRYRNFENINPVATTWLISFEHIAKTDPLATDYLSFMSCVDPRDIPQSLLPPAPSRKREVDAIGTLHAYAFISKRPGDNSLDLHHLVRLATRNWLRKEGALAKWMAGAVRRLDEVFPDSDHKNRGVWREYLPHARAVLDSDLGKGGVKEWENLVWKFGECLCSDGWYGEAERAFLEVSEKRKTVLGAEHPDTLASMASLASTYRNQGRSNEAESLEVQVMETAKRVLGAEHPDTLASMNNLASTYASQGRWKEAESLLVQATVTMKRTGRLLTLASIHNLASTYGNQGRWKEAELLLVQAMETMKRVLGAEHPDTLASMNNLASTYASQGRWKEAESLLVQVVETRKRVLGAEHPDMLISIAGLASTYAVQGRWKEAESLQIQVIKTMKRVLGAEHPVTLTNMNNLASTYMNQGRRKEAKSLLVQVVETRKRVLGAGHPHVLASMNDLARCQANFRGSGGGLGYGIRLGIGLFCLLVIQFAPDYSLVVLLLHPVALIALWQVGL